MAEYLEPPARQPWDGWTELQAHSFSKRDQWKTGYSIYVKFPDGGRHTGFMGGGNNDWEVRQNALAALYHCGAYLHPVWVAEAIAMLEGSPERNFFEEGLEIVDRETNGVNWRLAIRKR